MRFEQAETAGDRVAIPAGDSPIPGGITDFVRFLMSIPQAIQIVGGIIGGAVAIVAVVYLWRRRSVIADRLRNLPTWFKAAAIPVGLLAVALVGRVGYATYDYVEHDNTFCTSCHVMIEAYVRFTESAHAELGCHDCHQQPVTASLRQLFLWVVERPDHVGPHAPVPDARCVSCHVGEDSERWPQIAASIGHRLHFESEDPELGELMCVSCHGVAVHDFVPASTTCGECHEEADVRLGRMTGSTEMHCVVCHDFLGEEPVVLPGFHDEGVPMAPTRAECLGCHEMNQLLVQDDFLTEPHGGVCGACHNPHTQEDPIAAAAGCEGCHTEVETLTDFHRSLHAGIQENCMTCHSAHTWKADKLECLDCHSGILEDDLSPPGRRRPGQSGAVRSGPVPGGAVGSRLQRPLEQGGGSAPRPALSEEQREREW
jgi:hypothetical protein